MHRFTKTARVTFQKHQLLLRTQPRWIPKRLIRATDVTVCLNIVFQSIRSKEIANHSVLSSALDSCKHLLFRYWHLQCHVQQAVSAISLIDYFMYLRLHRCSSPLPKIHVAPRAPPHAPPQFPGPMKGSGAIVLPIWHILGFGMESLVFAHACHCGSIFRLRSDLFDQARITSYVSNESLSSTLILSPGIRKKP